MAKKRKAPILRQRDVKAAPDGLNPTGMQRLFLEVRNGGTSRAWKYRYWSHRHGCQKEVSIGPEATVLLEVAIQQASLHNRIIAEGKDPWDEEANRKKKDKIPTVDEMIDAFMATNIDVPGGNEKTKKSARQHLLRISRAIGPRAIDTVTVHDLLYKLGLIELYARPTGPSVGIQVFSYLKRVFEMAEAAGYLTKNPAVWIKLKPWLGKYEKNHRPKARTPLHREDALRFMKAVNEYEDGRNHRIGRMTSTYICQFVVLTGARVGEVTQATWGEIDLDRKVWTVPWQHLKNGPKHHADLARPITKTMMEILTEMKGDTDRPGDDNPVFPNDDGNYYNTNSILRFIKNSLKWTPEYGEPKITVHGFRTTITGWSNTCEKASLYSRLVDIQLDHMPKGNVAQAYGTQNDDWRLRCEVMEAWDQFCTRPITPDDNTSSNFPTAVAK